MWSEEEMREIEPEPAPARTGARGYAASLRRTLSACNEPRAAVFAHECTRGTEPSVIYAPGPAGHGNFVPASYRRIVAHAPWARRLEKAHTSKRQAGLTGVDEERRAWRELDSANSSDALLMNIFCYPRVLGRGLSSLLGVEASCVPEFGYRPHTPLMRGLVDATEIDMRLGSSPASLLVEAKLTESDFQRAPLRLLERYTAFAEVFRAEDLPLVRGQVQGYQLIRGVLAAHAGGGRFCLLCDARRPDLAEAWFAVARAVRSFELQSRLRLITWQEVAGALPAALRQFLRHKYGIEAAETRSPALARAGGPARRDRTRGPGARPAGKEAPLPED